MRSHTASFSRAALMALVLVSACDSRALPAADSGIGGPSSEPDARPAPAPDPPPLPPRPVDGGPAPVECVADEGCGPTEYCHVEGACKPGEDMAKVGECRPRPRPATCPTGESPVWVCGCDGQSYDGECLAHAAGTNVAHEGQCTGECGDLMYLPACKPGEVCDRKSCGAATGTCVPLPQCSDPGGTPVCGCDGQTYPDDCARLAAGAALDHPGACQKGSVALLTDQLIYGPADGNGSPPQLTLENGSSSSIFVGGCSAFTRQRQEGGAWVDKGQWVSCKWEGYAVEVPAGTSIADSFPVEQGGLWRLAAYYGVGCAAGKPLTEAACASYATALSDPYTVLADPQQCLALESSYAAALDAAQVCNSALAIPHCLLMAPATPYTGCACPTPVETDQQLKALLQEWKDLRCDQLPGGIACKCGPPPTNPGCVNGMCQ